MRFSQFIAIRKIKLALSILQLNMLLNRSKDHEVVFRSAWALAKKLDFLFDGFVSADNPRRYEVRQVVYLRLLRLLHRIKPGYVPKVTVLNEDVLTQIARDKSPSMIVTIHSPVDAVLNRILQERDIDASVLAANHTNLATKARLLGFEGQLELIANSRDALLSIRRDLRHHKTVHLCVDYKDVASDTQELFISSASFRLAATMAVNVVFSDTWVNRDGDIELHLQPHDLTPAASPDDAARAFLRWLKTDRGHTRDWTIISARRRDPDE